MKKKKSIPVKFLCHQINPAVTDAPFDEQMPAPGFRPVRNKPIFINQDKVVAIIENTLGEVYPKLTQMLVVQIKAL
ncbi:hypothetical protein [Mucilaginibacter sp.]|uniref:hypothetical protein n=1 Tax=Mucilaginibacter sp. TaxID=1882438 RepID=UPI00261F3F8A|nr:hypothetical protein [Mucilaginibacter sp.]MDB4919831.1 hypothetical protein [Mucilaginibacter sp.]